ncbi:MAG: hypothetical protein K9L64_06350 [Candidatus Izimaplasma sp.]|nr:hypothetical protein [Candidatus Izimaplasma bacterium]
MIDIHTHLLPYVDDGVNDFNEALEIINALKKQGVNSVFITPHYYKLRNFVSTYDENLKIFNELKALVHDKGIDIKLYLGSEIYYDQHTLKNIKDSIVKDLINRFYLVEFSIDESLYNISEAVHNLVAKGYKPVIAHIERYEALKKIEDVYSLKKIGAYTQVNASTVLGSRGFFKKVSINKFIKNDLIDFVATDSHNNQVDKFIKAYQYIEKKFSKEKAEKLFNNQIIFNK